MIPDPKCKKCGHRQQRSDGNPDICLLDNSPVGADNYCPHYTESPYICEMCGRHLLPELVNYTIGVTSPYHMLCLDCYKLVGTCNSCTETATCRFEQDSTISEPPYVTQQIRQGNTVMQTQVKNPKRINLTCKVNCPCFINGYCARADGFSCEKYNCSVSNW